MKLETALLFIAVLAVPFVHSCDNSVPLSVRPEFRLPVYSISDLNTQLPVDAGTVHNAILDELGAASATSGSLGTTEFLLAFRDAANAALAPYQPSRLLTRDDCALILSIGRVVDPLYDFELDDPLRADPLTVIDYWTQTEFLTVPEADQIRLIFQPVHTDSAMAMARAMMASPVSETVALTASVFTASVEFWTVEGLGGCTSAHRQNQLGDDDPTQHLRRVWSDAFGAAIGSMLGGPLGAAFVGAGTSTLFIIDHGCWPDPCQGDNPPVPPQPCPTIGPCEY